MSRSKYEERRKVDSSLYETEYLISTVGPILARGLAEIVERRPNDPIEYLATFLYKQADLMHANKKEGEDVKSFQEIQEKVKQEEQRRFELQNELRVLREREEQYRKQRKARKQEQDTNESTKQYEILTISSPTPSTSSKDSRPSTADSGKTKLHRKAATTDARLSKLLRANYLAIAARNSKGKTPRDVALDAGLQENVNQIDTFCLELLTNGNKAAIIDLILNGYTIIADQFKSVEIKDEATHNFVHFEIPKLLTRIKTLQQAIKRGDQNTIEVIVRRHRNIALYRDSKGSSSLHYAIEKRQFHIALYLVQIYPSLATIKNISNRSAFDILNSINRSSLPAKEHGVYDQLQQALIL